MRSSVLPFADINGLLAGMGVLRLRQIATRVVNLINVKTSIHLPRSILEVWPGAGR